MHRVVGQLSAGWHYANIQNKKGRCLSCLLNKTITSNNRYVWSSAPSRPFPRPPARQAWCVRVLRAGRSAKLAGGTRPGTRELGARRRVVGEPRTVEEGASGRRACIMDAAKRTGEGRPKAKDTRMDGCRNSLPLNVPSATPARRGWQHDIPRTGNTSMSGVRPARKRGRPGEVIRWNATGVMDRLPFNLFI